MIVWLLLLLLQLTLAVLFSSPPSVFLLFALVVVLAVHTFTRWRGPLLLALLDFAELNRQTWQRRRRDGLGNSLFCRSPSALAVMRWGKVAFFAPSAEHMCTYICTA